MKRIPATLLALLVCGTTGFAQIEKILAPLDNRNAPQTETRSVQPANSADKHAAQILTAEVLLPLLEKRLTEHFSLKGELKLGLVRPWQTVKLPDDQFDLTITDYPGEGVASSFLVRCKIISGGQNVGEWQIALRAQLWQEVWVASGRLDRGQTLDRSLLTGQKVDVLYDHQSLVSSDLDPSHYEVAQSVAAGRPLTKHDIVERPLIRKGQVVEAIASQGLLAVSMKAQALENGAASDLIKMRNLESRKDFTAQVINENQVQVHF